MTTPSEPRILIVAGPNGAGKTTFARQFLPQEGDCPTFVNADLIGEHFDCRESFAFETTLAGRSYARSIRRWRDAGYRVTLFFLSLSSPEIAISRVAQRVRQGGHDIPEEIIRRRFTAGHENFELLHKPIVTEWFLYDNGGDEPILLEAGENQ